MSNALYGKGRNRFLKGEINWISDTVKVILVDTDYYSVQIDTHEYLSDIPAQARVATGTLANKTATLGVADADDVTLTSVTGNQCEALVLYKDTGNESTSPLIAYIDTGTGLPITPNGGDIIIQWDNGANKIFKL